MRTCGWIPRRLLPPWHDRWMRTNVWSRIRARFAEDRGDVPGWVLITLMTAALVILIWALAAPALSNIFQNAIDKVAGI